MPVEIAQPARTERRPRPPFVPSPAFGALVAAFVLSAWALATNAVPPKYALAAFALAGWLVSLCLHEFGHALAAYLQGDRSVADKGYLTLDPFRYADPVTSIILPLGLLLIGGFALPGGCVYVNLAALRGRHAPAIVSAAGPAANLAVLLAVAATFATGIVDAAAFTPVCAGLALLAYLQALALVLNLLPIPGLDGFGILRPYLPASARERLDALGTYAWILLLGAILFVPGVSRLLWSVPLGLLDRIGIPSDIARSAFEAALFWL
jgi:Zn-dependent protease